MPEDDGLTEDTVILSNAETPPPAVPELVVVAGPAVGRQLRLSNKPVVLGRSPECEFPLHGTAISRKHARVEPGEQGYVICDLGSKNGTVVNGVAIDRHELRDGDIVKVGDCVIKYLHSAGSEAHYLRRLCEMSARDPLTDAANRRTFDEALQAALARAAAGLDCVALILCDVDHFKAVNDRYGHPAGDDVLRSISETVRSCIRERDLFGRLGGEEFGILCCGGNLSGASALAERVRHAVETKVIKTGAHSVSVTLSFGVATCDAGATMTREELYGLADERLYSAKRAGRNRVRVA